MGCCEIQLPSTYTLTTSEKSQCQSILLKKKRYSEPKKTVRFEISFTCFNKLIIPEETKTPWYVPVSETDTSLWTLHKTNEILSLKYTENEKNIYSSLIITLGIAANHETILCLLNNPKYRVIWDTEVKKMELVFGDTNLDANVIMENHSCEKSRLSKRVVRKFNETFYIAHSFYGECCENDCMIIAIYDGDKVVITWVEYPDQATSLDKKFLWGLKLYSEIMIHKNNSF